MSAMIWEGSGFVEKPTSDGNHKGHYLVPGLVDTHIHGAFGYDFMDGDGNSVIQELRKIGIEFACLTSVTSNWEDLRKAIDAVDTKNQGFCGFHLEGPYLNPVKAGAQPHHFRDPDFNELSAELESRLEKIRVITFAPELEGASELARHSSKYGIQSSAGHTDATFEQLIECRPDRMTHFFNAMRQFHHRSAGPIDYGLTQEVDLELIYDGHHFSHESADLVVRTKPVSQIIGISDGTRLSGIPDGATAEMWGHQVKKQEGAVRLADGTLAGSGSTLVEVFRNFWEQFGPTVATMACSVNPRRSIGLPEPRMWLWANDSGTILEVMTGAAPF